MSANTRHDPLCLLDGFLDARATGIVASQRVGEQPAARSSEGCSAKRRDGKGKEREADDEARGEREHGPARCEQHHALKPSREADRILGGYCRDWATSAELPR